MAIGYQQRREPEPPVETRHQRAARLKSEASMLAVAVTDLEAGRFIGEAGLDAWLDAWERGEDAPLPDAAASSNL